MRLANIHQKIKEIPDLPKDIFILLLIALITLGAYMLSREADVRKLRAGQLRILSNGNFETTEAETSVRPGVNGTLTTRGETGAANTIPAISKGAYIGSINGKTYHLPWCSGATRIREENKVWFSSKESAQQSGYAPAANCKGI